MFSCKICGLEHPEEERASAPGNYGRECWNAYMKTRYAFKKQGKSIDMTTYRAERKRLGLPVPDVTIKRGRPQTRERVATTGLFICPCCGFAKSSRSRVPAEIEDPVCMGCYNTWVAQVHPKHPNITIAWFVFFRKNDLLDMPSPKDGAAQQAKFVEQTKQLKRMFTDKFNTPGEIPRG
jgi:rubredoxin